MFNLAGHRSPNLTPPDFFSMGVLKNALYAKKPRKIDQLKQSLQQEWNQISVDIIIDMPSSSSSGS